MKKSLNFLKNKAKTLEDIYNNAKYLISDELKINDEDLKLIDDKAKKIINEFSKNINESSKFTKEKFEEILNQLIKKHQTNFKNDFPKKIFATKKIADLGGQHKISNFAQKSNLMKSLIKIN